MKVTSIGVYASNPSNFFTLSFRDPTNQNPYVVKSITGLDADEITPKFYDGSGMNNDRYYDLSLTKRDIVIQISLNPMFTLNKSYSDLRDDLFKIISSSRTGAVQLQFNNGTTTVAVISGFVTKFEAPNFTKTPEVQITINCSDPMLKSLIEVNVNVASLNPQNTTLVDNESTSPHGFRFGVKFWETIIDFSIQDLDVPTWAFEVNLTGTPQVEFGLGDELHFSSEFNNRYLYMVRDFDIIHLVDRIIPTSVWPVLFPGTNTFVCSDNVNWDYITHYPTYWGV